MGGADKVVNDKGGRATKVSISTNSVPIKPSSVSGRGKKIVVNWFKGVTLTKDDLALSQILRT